MPKVKSIDKLKAAAEGTVAHELLEVSIITGDDPQNALGKPVTVFEEDEMDFPITFYIDQEMIDAVKMFLDHIHSYEGVRYAELTMQHSEVPELQGTGDFLNISGSHLNLDDLKYGKSTVMAVSRNGKVNTQLLCYTSLAFDKWPVLETATVSIVQPRAKTKKKIRSVDLTRADVDSFMLDVKRVVEDNAKLEAGELQILDTLQDGGHCWFCKSKGSCPLRKQKEAEEAFK